MGSVREWIEKHLRLQVNATKSGIGRVWERKFLGFRLNRERQIEVAPESMERFQTKVRELWRSGQSRTGNQLRDAWQQYVRGLVGVLPTGRESPMDPPAGGMDFAVIRKCFWLRWHAPEGRERRLRSLGLRGRLLKHRGAWHSAGTGSLQRAAPTRLSVGLTFSCQRI